jgi:hypothetical protein
MREVYKGKVYTGDGLLARIMDAAARVKKRANQLNRTTRDLGTWVAKCTEVDGEIFEHLLSTVTNLSIRFDKFCHLNIKLKFKMKLTESNSFLHYPLRSMCICRFKQLYLSNHSELDMCSYELFFSQWQIISPAKILTFPRLTPCILVLLSLVSSYEAALWYMTEDGSPHSQLWQPQVLSVHLTYKTGQFLTTRDLKLSLRCP